MGSPSSDPGYLFQGTRPNYLGRRRGVMITKVNLLSCDRHPTETRTAQSLVTNSIESPTDKLHLIFPTFK